MVLLESEFSPLKKVAVATPSKEKERLTPQTLFELQYAEIPDLEELRKEHDEFKGKLRQAGAEVIDLRDEIKKLSKEEMLELLVSDCVLETSSLSKEEIADILISGLTVTEAKSKGILKKYIVGDSEDLCVKPLVNIMFTRDPGMVIGNVYVQGKMRWESRRREPELYVKILKPEKVVKAEKGYFEGGDFMPIGYGKLLMGFGTRSSALGVNDVIPKLESEGVLDEAVLVRLETPELHPNKGIGHLDTVMGIPAKDVIIYYQSYLDKMKVYIYKGGEAIRDQRPLREVLKDYLARDLRVVPIGNNEYYAEEREHWLLASNIIVVDKNTIIAYDHNRITNKLLTEVGINVITFKGNEIIKEGGERSGPRCMTLPLIKI
ncbi:arginine deiminase [Acidianus sulfidivorans JP7]|uniref:Arginine deiminase n=1 Tax=Acidianus sulfidivorans JP7 TaxID=619593 RepID=A0A2U9ILF8_9CREN|nr:arginine deiminase family protein [Acidianus sulfidivorans]AWR96851.1 arginine deiminase [Acidianus sulfidivorans JP7]